MNINFSTSDKEALMIRMMIVNIFTKLVTLLNSNGVVVASTRMCTLETIYH